MKKLALFAVVVTAACTKTESSDILTSGINASISATAAGDGTTVVGATLLLGNPLDLNFVDLTGDDRLVASHGGEDKVMTETTLLNIVSHTATFQTDNADDEFEVALERTVDAGAPSSIATLPAPFTIAQPAATVSRAQAMTLSWSPANTQDTMRWSLTGDCIELAGATLTGDTGTVAIPANTIRKAAGAMVADSCQVTLSIHRTREGHLDAHYGKGGSVTGEQVRTVTFTTTP